MTITLRCDRIIPVDVNVPRGFTLETDGLTVRCGEAQCLGGFDGEKWTLSGLYVPEEQRNQGLGRALCQQTLKLLRRENALPLYAVVDGSQIPALMLLTSLGFKVQRDAGYAQAIEELRRTLTEAQMSAVDRCTEAEVRLCNLSAIKYDARGLVPAIAQDAGSGEVLMQAYMNEESLRLTLETGDATYFSRSRQQLWRKGETSGHTQKVRRLTYDCDGDCILMQVDQIGPACHTGARTCFHNPVVDGDMPATPFILETIMATVADRAANPKAGSYTNYLLDKGAEKLCKKVGEESSEVIIAAMKGDGDALASEAADLLYHLTVLLYERGVPWRDVWEVLKARHS